MSRVATTCHKSIFDKDVSENIYMYLRDNINWIDGVRSKNGFTRKACPMCIGDDNFLDNIIFATLQKIGIEQCEIRGIYLNYYRTGQDYTPMHSHTGMKQVVISFGHDRTLVVAKKNYILSSGDVIMFGSAMHGVPREPEILEGRISIALFLSK